MSHPSTRGSRFGETLWGLILRGDRALIALVLVISFRAPDLLWNQLGLRAVGAVLAGTILLAMMLRAITTGWRPTGWKSPMGLVSVYFLVCLICVTQARDAQQSVPMTVDIIKGATILFMMICLCRSMRSLRRVVAAMLFAGLVMGTISILQQWTGTFEFKFASFGQGSFKTFPEGYQLFRSKSVIGDPNYYAQVIIILIPLAVVGLWRVRRPMSVVVLFWTGLVCVLTVMSTYSRGGFVTMLAVLGMLGLLAIKYRPQRKAVGLTIALLVAAVLLMPSHYVTRMSTFGRFIPTAGDDSPIENLSQEIGLRGRLSAAIVGVNMFKDHPLLGVGPGNFRIHYPAYAHELEIDPSKNIVRVAHNHYLAVAAETGLLGSAAFMALLVGFCRRMHNARKRLAEAGLHEEAVFVAAIIVAIYGFLMSSMFLDTGYIYHFWLLAGIAFALPVIADHEIGQTAGPSRVVEADHT